MRDEFRRWDQTDERGGRARGSREREPHVRAHDLRAAPAPDKMHGANEQPRNECQELEIRELDTMLAENADGDHRCQCGAAPPRRFTEKAIDEEKDERYPCRRRQELGEVYLDHHAALVGVHESRDEARRTCHREMAAQQIHPDARDGQMQDDVHVDRELRSYDEKNRIEGIQKPEMGAGDERSPACLVRVPERNVAVTKAAEPVLHHRVVVGDQIGDREVLCIRRRVEHRDLEECGGDEQIAETDAEIGSRLHHVAVVASAAMLTPTGSRPTCRSAAASSR